MRKCARSRRRQRLVDLLTSSAPRVVIRETVGFSLHQSLSVQFKEREPVGHICRLAAVTGAHSPRECQLLFRILGYCGDFGLFIELNDDPVYYANNFAIWVIFEKDPVRYPSISFRQFAEVCGTFCVSFSGHQKTEKNTKCFQHIVSNFLIILLRCAFPHSKSSTNKALIKPQFLGDRALKPLSITEHGSKVS